MFNFARIFKPSFILLVFFLSQVFLFSQEGAYVNSISITQGDTLKFYVSTSSDIFSMRITRFYSSDVSLRVAEFGNLTGGIKAVPADAYMNGCRWPETFRVVVPESWEPGMYRATFPTSMGGGGVIFFVKAKVQGSHSGTLLVLNTATWQAYNNYGGKSLYPSSSPDRSYKVSFLRPSSHYWGAYNFFKHEMLYLSWMHKNNRNTEFATDYDIHSDPSLLSKYKVVVFAGHAEYWSLNQRNNLQNYINSGGKLMILSGNTSWWQVRYEDGGNTLVCYKSRTADPMNGVNDAIVTVNWYAAPVNNPENKLTGVSFRAGGYVNHGSTLPASQGYGDYAALNTHHWIYKGTGLNDGDEYGYEDAIVGNEVDGAEYIWKDGLPVVTGQDGTPLSYRILGITPAYNANPSFNYANGTPGIYYTSGGGAVFNAATIKWIFGLASNTTVQKITENIYGRFINDYFPPDITAWTPFVVEDVVINKENIHLNKRNLSVQQGENIRFSVKAADPKGKAVSFRWFVGNTSTGTDSVFNFTAVSGTSIVKVMAYNDRDTTQLSWSIESDGQPGVPPVPVLASPADNSLNVPLNTNLTWNSSAGADYYDLQISLTSGFENPVTSRTSELSLAQSLVSSTQYYWRVRSGNTAGSSEYSSAWSFTTQGGIPGEVVLVYPEKNQRNLPSSITFIWMKSTGANSYKLEVSSDKQFKNIVFSFPGLTDTLKNISGFQNKKNYHWRVTAYNQYGESTSELRQFAVGGNSQPMSGSGEITKLQAYLINGSILLKWSSEMVLPGEYFEIQKTTPEGNWENISVIHSSDGQTEYSYDFQTGDAQEYKITIIKYDADGTIISEAEMEPVVVNEYVLKQNYPNPFNPVTNIDFILITDSRVKMNLYSITGELIRTMINSDLNAGVHSYRLDAGELSSGIYFYTFEAVSVSGSGQYSSIKKLMLLK
jgi:hypothetical protein